MNQITLSENVMVSDPCYTTDTWCQTKLDNVLPGLYNVEVEKSDEGDWGEKGIRYYNTSRIYNR